MDEIVDSIPAIVHYMIPPALSYVAAYVGAKTAFAQSDAFPPTPIPIIVLRREGTPPQFVFAEIVY